MIGQRTEHRSEKGYSFSDLFCIQFLGEGEDKINKPELKAWANNLVNLKIESLGFNGSKGLKRRDIEAYIEEEAKKKNIEFKTDDHPTKPIYTLSQKEEAVFLEVYYRYKTFYTRHRVFVGGQEG